VRCAPVLYLGHLDEHVSEGIEWLLEDDASSAALQMGEVRSIRALLHQTPLHCNKSIDAG